MLDIQQAVARFQCGGISGINAVKFVIAQHREHDIRQVARVGTNLEFAYGANELGASRLAEQVVTTAALAAQKVYARIAAVTEEFNESFGDMLAARPAE